MELPPPKKEWAKYGPPSGTAEVMKGFPSLRCSPSLLHLICFSSLVTSLAFLFVPVVSRSASVHENNS